MENPPHRVCCEGEGVGRHRVATLSPRSKEEPSPSRLLRGRGSGTSLRRHGAALPVVFAARERRRCRAAALSPRSNPPGRVCCEGEGVGRRHVVASLHRRREEPSPSCLPRGRGCGASPCRHVVTLEELPVAFAARERARGDVAMSSPRSRGPPGRVFSEGEGASPRRHVVASGQEQTLPVVFAARERKRALLRRHILASEKGGTLPIVFAARERGCRRVATLSPRSSPPRRVCCKGEGEGVGVRVGRRCVAMEQPSPSCLLRGRGSGASSRCQVVASE